MTAMLASPLKEHGFTLLELLVSLAAGILLIAALSEILITIKDGWTRATGIEQQWTDEVFTRQLISRILDASIPPEQNNKGIHFKGTENSIEFSTIPSQATFTLGRMDGRLFLTPRPNGLFALELSLEEPAMSKSKGKLIGQTWTLLNGVKTIEILYSSRGSCQSSRLWVAMDKLPELIKLHIVFADKTRLPFWIIVHPHQTISGNCLIDSTSFMCRTS